MTLIATDVSALIPDQVLRHVDGGWYRFKGVARVVSEQQPQPPSPPTELGQTPIGVGLVGLAKHSEDKSEVAVLVVAGHVQWQAILMGKERQQDAGEVVVYEHLWPFEEGLWVRPIAEFPSRFTPADASDLLTAQQQPREEAQTQVDAHRAARRLAAAQG